MELAQGDQERILRNWIQRAQSIKEILLAGKNVREFAIDTRYLKHGSVVLAVPSIFAINGIFDKFPKYGDFLAHINGWPLVLIRHNDIFILSAKVPGEPDRYEIQVCKEGKNVLGYEQDSYITELDTLCRCRGDQDVFSDEWRGELHPEYFTKLRPNIMRAIKRHKYES